jgi:hypothetical protein
MGIAERKLGPISAMVGSELVGRLERLCSPFCIFVLVPKLLRAHAVGAEKMPSQMRLIGKTGFRCHIRDRAPFAGLQQQLLGVSQPTMQQVLMRR